MGAYLNKPTGWSGKKLLKINAPPIFLPIAVAGGLRPFTASNFHCGFVAIFVFWSLTQSMTALIFRRFFRHICYHFVVSTKLHFILNPTTQTAQTNMNSEWKSFLSSRGAVLEEDDRIIFNKKEDPKTPWVCSLENIGVIAFTGADTVTFLQGQTTCDINRLTDSHSTLGAYCNPKGRVITVIRVIKSLSTFYWLLSAELLPSVIKRLRMYVLRSDVQIQEITEPWCLLGISNPPTTFPASVGWNNEFPAENGEINASEDMLILKHSAFSNRLLIVASVTNSIRLWKHLTALEGFAESGPAFWEEMDVLDGIPHLVQETSEQFIPQMLNLDLLGGVSFDKGCYTGQEIVARTHYLGKLKRRMFLACCQSTKQYAPNTSIFDGDDTTGQSLGNLVTISATSDGNKIMLIVLQMANAENKNLRIRNPDGEKIKILKLPYTV